MADEAIVTRRAAAPRVGADPGAALRELLEVMRRLRDPQGGCPWDLAQDFSTIAPHTLEEAYEVADAIERGAPRDIRDELGDLLFQVVFHSRLGEERGWFDFGDVAAGIAAKLRRRHPHVFGDGWRDRRGRAGRELGAHQGRRARRRGRRRGARRHRAFAAGTVARGEARQACGPGRLRLAGCGRRARQGRGGAGGTRRSARAGPPSGATGGAGPGADASARRAEELGDLLFAVANWGRHLGIDPEEALRAANRKFERRFASIEAAARARQRPLEYADAAGMGHAVGRGEARRLSGRGRGSSGFQADCSSKRLIACRPAVQSAFIDRAVTSFPGSQKDVRRRSGSRGEEVMSKFRSFTVVAAAVGAALVAQSALADNGSSPRLGKQEGLSSGPRLLGHRLRPGRRRAADHAPHPGHRAAPRVLRGNPLRGAALRRLAFARWPAAGRRFDDPRRHPRRRGRQPDRQR